MIGARNELNHWYINIKIAHRRHI